ncbi:MAG: four helix bundle protein [Armatimonadota bacterium]
MRRCAASVPANIAEQRGRHNDGDFTRVLCIAVGSLAETETFIELARRLNLASEDELVPLEQAAEEAGRVLHGLMAATRGAPP